MVIVAQKSCTPSFTRMGMLGWNIFYTFICIADRICSGDWRVKKNISRIPTIHFCSTWLYAMEPKIVKGGKIVCCIPGSIGFSSLIRASICIDAQELICTSVKECLWRTHHTLLKVKDHRKLHRAIVRMVWIPRIKYTFPWKCVLPSFHKNVESVIISRSPCKKCINHMW